MTSKKYYKKSKTNTKLVKENADRYSRQIKQLDHILKDSSFLTDGSYREFISSMYKALVSGRKITTKMENAINNIIKRNSPEEQFKRDEWVEKVVPKLMMVNEMISNTNWKESYKADTYRFMNSLIEQAKSRKSLTTKQMEAASKIYARVKKNIDKQK